MVVPISGSVEEIPFHGVAIQMKPFWLTTFTYCLWGILLNFYFDSFGSVIVKTYICVCLFLIDQVFFRWLNTIIVTSHWHMNSSSRKTIKVNKNTDHT